MEDEGEQEREEVKDRDENPLKVMAEEVEMQVQERIDVEKKEIRKKEEVLNPLLEVMDE